MNWCLLRSHLRSCKTIAQISVRNMAGKTGIGKKRFRLPANTETEYLVNNVSGSNIYKDGKDVEIKTDDQYPDWLWTMHLGRPKRSNELEYGTTEYWEALALESNVRLKRFMSVRHKTTMRVGLVERRKMEWQERIKYRALAGFNYEPGYRPEDVDQHEPHMTMWLRPQPTDEALYPDQFVREKKAFFRRDNLYSQTEVLDLPLLNRCRLRKKGYHPVTGGVLTKKSDQSPTELESEVAAGAQQLSK